MTVRQDFEATAGTTRSVSFTVTGALFLSASTITWRLAESPNGERVLEKTQAAGITIVDDNNITILIAAGDVPDWGLYYHALQKVSGGITYPLATGRAVFRPSPQAA